MKKIIKNRKIGIAGLAMVLAGMISVGILAFFLIFVSCRQDTPQQEYRTNSMEDKDYVHLKPRSSLSEEELALLQRLKKVIYENMQVEDNMFVFNLDRDSFINMNIPGKYYDLLMQNIRENNYFLDSLSIHNASLLEEILNGYREQQASFKRDPAGWD
jgi:hypothetical protein